MQEIKKKKIKEGRKKGSCRAMDQNREDSTFLNISRQSEYQIHPSIHLCHCYCLAANGSLIYIYLIYLEIKQQRRRSSMVRTNDIFSLFLLYFLR